MGRLIYRTLTFANDTPGEELSIRPDLAESQGTPSDGRRTWTYTLRKGLKHEDGTPITAGGLDVVVDTHPQEEFAALIDGVTGWDLVDDGGLCFDWPTATTVVLPVMGPDTAGTSWGPRNTARYFDPKYSDHLQALKSSPEDSAAIAQKAVDTANEIQTTAWPYLPIQHQNDLQV